MLKMARNTVFGALPMTYQTASCCFLVLSILSLRLVSGGLPSTITVGAVLSSLEHGELFRDTIAKANKDGVSLPPGLVLNSTYILMDDNPIRAAKAICEELIPSQVYVTIASHPQNTDLSPMAVSFTCGFYKIPVIGISARESTFSDKNVHSAFMRTVPPYSEQAEIWVNLVQSLGFNRVIFMHTSDQEGRAMLGKFQSKAEANDVEIERNVQYTTGHTNFTEYMTGFQNLSSRVVLLYAGTDDAERIYSDASRLNLTGTGYAWIVTEQALFAPNTPVGVLGLKLKHADDEDSHIKDSVVIITSALRAMEHGRENVTEAPDTCDDGSNPWHGGPLILRYMVKEKVESGATGYVAFNSAGDRIGSTYDIVNLHPSGLVTVGDCGADREEMNIREKSIVWPGNKVIKPKGIKISTHLKVVTIAALPFVYVEPVGKDDNKCDVTLNKIPCPKYNSTEGTVEENCCYGYAIDLLIDLAKEVNFTYDLHLVEDGAHGSLERRNGSQTKTWNGMVGEVISGKADLIVSPLTINPERAEALDFSKPFKYQGLTILVKKTPKDSNLASFLQPFQDTLWILVGLSVHVVALVLYLLDRFSPFGRFKLAKSDDTEEDALNLSSAMWFAWGVLLNSGIGEGTPRSFSARVLGMVWAGFAMIIVASYTANLAAFLVLDRPEASISGIDDARLRNPQEKFKYATVKNSAVAMYFKRQVELSTMYRTMEGKNLDTEEEAIERVRKGRLHAFIWDSSRLKYEAANDCDLVTAGELFGRSGYGIGLQKGSPWSEDISLAILSFHEVGFMEELDGKWILVKDTKCPEKDSSPATLGLTNMAGVFMMVAGGIVTGVFLIFIEIAYKRHRGLKEKELELAKTAADRWRGNIERRKQLRKSRELLRREKQESMVQNGPNEKTDFAAHPTAAATGTQSGGQQGEQRRHPGGQPGPLQPPPGPEPLPRGGWRSGGGAYPAVQVQSDSAAPRLPAGRYQYQI